MVEKSRAGPGFPEGSLGFGHPLETMFVLLRKLLEHVTSPAYLRYLNMYLYAVTICRPYEGTTQLWLQRDQSCGEAARRKIQRTLRCLIQPRNIITL